MNVEQRGHFELLDQLDDLHAAGATEGAWNAERIFWKLKSDYIPDGYWRLVQDDAGTVAALTEQDDDEQDTAADRAALIVATVNALPKLTAALRAVEKLAYASDDGTEYEHNGHDHLDGEPECPACWAEGIRNVLVATLSPAEANR